jgi:uncharacterized phage infection (PIP) family protein YhgE
MADERNLELKSIIAKFNQSSTALDSLTEKIEALASSSAEISRAEAGITESQLQVRRMADEIKLISTELKRANSAVENSLHSVASFLQSTELGAMQQGIEKIANSLDVQIRELAAKVEEKKVQETELTNQIAVLNAKIDAVPEKLQKKLGWKK